MKCATILVGPDDVMFLNLVHATNQDGNAASIIYSCRMKMAKSQLVRNSSCKSVKMVWCFHVALFSELRIEGKHA
jgi:hypothetical protein